MTGSIALSGLLIGFVTANSFARMQSDEAPPRLTVVSDNAGSKTAQLLLRCAQSDQRAFRELYDLSSAKLYGVALRITRNPALAADAVHDAMLQVWRNADRYSPDRGNADGWLASLVRYRALDIIRRNGRETTGVDVPEQVDEDPDALTRLMADADGAALRACMEEVDPARRRLVVLAFIEGLTQIEVAERVNQPLGTVKSTIRRVLQALRSCLEQGAKVLRS
jgi:RNA polymerase sigma-70 factor (ECF subfamily)